MAHTALAESLSDLSNHLNVWILILNPKNLPRLEAYLSKYVDNLSIKDSSTLELFKVIYIGMVLIPCCGGGGRRVNG